MESLSECKGLWAIVIASIEHSDHGQKFVETRA